MKYYLTFDKTSGRYTGAFSGESFIQENLKDGDGFIEVPFPIRLSECKNYMVNLETLSSESRPILEIEVNKSSIQADGEDKIVISNIPNDVESIFIDDQMYVLDSNEVEFTSTSRGTYRIKIDQFPYVVWEIEVEVV